MKSQLKAGMLFFWLLGFTVSAISQKDLNALDLNTLIQPLTEDGIFRDSAYYNWGGSIIQGEDHLFHLFYSRWKRTYTFAGWLTFSEIAHATSDKPTGPWEYKESVLKGRGPGHWDAITAHNPKIKFFEGKYYLYYISTNFGKEAYTKTTLENTNGKSLQDINRRKLRENQRTGVAIAHTLDGPWKRLDLPIIEPSGPIVTLTVNPAIEQGGDNNYYLIVKGDKPNETKFIRNQAIAIGKSPLGPFTMQNKPVIGNLDTEDVSMWFDKERSAFFAAFHAHTFIGLMTSSDGLRWEKAENYVITNKEILLADNALLIPDRMERPFIYVEDNRPSVLCLAVKKANDSFTVFIPLDKNDD